MLGKRTRPAIGKIAGAIRSGIVDSATSPRSPLECKMHSPRGLKNYDQGGIGLGIVVALDKSSNGSRGGEILAKYAICGPLSTRSSPIPVNPSNKNGYNQNSSVNNSNKFKGQMVMERMEGLDEEFTYVTCHGPNRSVTTRVYYDGGEFGSINQNTNAFKISPVKSVHDRSDSDSDSDFLSSCHLCRKNLHGKDIYMYRGEKAFCSAECRQRQIGMDERREKCRSEASRSVDVVSSSPYSYNTTSRGPIFFSPGIVAV